MTRRASLSTAALAVPIQGASSYTHIGTPSWASLVIFLKVLTSQLLMQLLTARVYTHANAQLSRHASVTSVWNCLAI
jgi:hypothetical protein